MRLGDSSFPALELKSEWAEGEKERFEKTKDDDEKIAILLQESEHPHTAELETIRAAFTKKLEKQAKAYSCYTMKCVSEKVCFDGRQYDSRAGEAITFYVIERKSEQETVRPGMLYFHDGGFRGTAKGNIALAARMVSDWNIRVFLMDYSLVGDKQMPTQVLEAYCALCFIRDNFATKFQVMSSISLGQAMQFTMSERSSLSEQILEEEELEKIEEEGSSGTQYQWNETTSSSTGEAIYSTVGATSSIGGAFSSTDKMTVCTESKKEVRLGAKESKTIADVDKTAIYARKKEAGGNKKNGMCCCGGRERDVTPSVDDSVEKKNSKDKPPPELRSLLKKTNSITDASPGKYILVDEVEVSSSQKLGKKKSIKKEVCETPLSKRWTSQGHFLVDHRNVFCCGAGFGGQLVVALAYELAKRNESSKAKFCLAISPTVGKQFLDLSSGDLNAFELAKQHLLKMIHNLLIPCDKGKEMKDGEKEMISFDKEKKSDKDYYNSPNKYLYTVLMEPEVIKKFPKCVIITEEFSSQRRNSEQLALLLKESNKLIDFFVQPGAYDTPFLDPECSSLSDEFFERVNQLLEKRLTWMP